MSLLLLLPLSSLLPLLRWLFVVLADSRGCDELSALAVLCLFDVLAVLSVLAVLAEHVWHAKLADVLWLCVSLLHAVLAVLLVAVVHALLAWPSEPL